MHMRRAPAVLSLSVLASCQARAPYQDYCTFELRKNGTEVTRRETRRFDAAGRLASEEIDFDGHGMILVTTYTYDSRGRLLTEERRQKESGSLERIRYQYDANGVETREAEVAGVWRRAPPRDTTRRWPPEYRAGPEETDTDDDGKPDRRVEDTFDRRRNLVSERIIDLRTGDSQVATYGYACFEHGAGSEAR